MDVYALDRYQQIGLITTATRVQVVERDLKEGAWLVELPLGGSAEVGAEMMAATWPGIELHDPETGWRFGGYLTDHAVIVDADGAETLRLVGSDFQSDLARWLEWPEPTTPDEWWANTVGGTIAATSDAHNTVKFNAGTLAASGRPQIDGLQFGPNPAAGAPKARRLKGEPLLEVCRFLFADSTEWTARLRLMRSTAGDGFVQFDTPARQLAPLVLDVKRGTFGRAEVTRSASRYTWVLAMGAEVEPVVTAGERHVAIVSSVEPNWRFRHREVALNRPATDDTDALGAEASATMLDPANWRPQSVKVDQARVDGWGRDIDLGWLVDVYLGRTFSPTTARLPVVASTLDFTPETGWVRTVDLGTESLDGPRRIYASVAAVAAQLRKLESDSR